MSEGALCPKGDGCALNKGARHCFHCGRTAWKRARDRGVGLRTHREGETVVIQAVRRDG